MCCGCRSAWGCSYCTNSSRIYSECLGELRRARNSEITSVRGFCVPVPTGAGRDTQRGERMFDPRQDSVSASSKWLNCICIAAVIRCYFLENSEGFGCKRGFYGKKNEKILRKGARDVQMQLFYLILEETLMEEFILKCEWSLWEGKVVSQR